MACPNGSRACAGPDEPWPCAKCEPAEPVAPEAVMELRRRFYDNDNRLEEDE